MEWKEAKENTIRYWQDLRAAAPRRDEIQMLRDINAISDLCRLARKEANGRWGRCEYCLFYRQFGGCEGISLRMSECVVDQDWEVLRGLMDQFISELKALQVPPAAAAAPPS